MRATNPGDRAVIPEEVLGKLGGGSRGRVKMAEMSSGPPENGVFVWGADEGQGGDCVGGPEVPHRLAPP